MVILPVFQARGLRVPRRIGVGGLRRMPAKEASLFPAVASMEGLGGMCKDHGAFCAGAFCAGAFYAKIQGIHKQLGEVS